MVKLRFIAICWFIPTLASAQVVFTEVHWVGSKLSTADEWFELTNISAESVHLTAWQVTSRKSDGSDATIYTFEDELLEPQQTLLVANYGVERSTLSVHPQIITSAVSLPNSKLYLELINAEESVIDTVDDGVGAPFFGGKEPFSSMERVDVHADGSEKQSWRVAEVSSGLDGEQLGTPGTYFAAEQAPQSSASSASSQESSAEQAEQIGAVIISEVMLNPEGSDDYEWIELQNLEDAPVDILGWVLSDGSRNYEIAPRNHSGYTLLPGEYAVFFGYDTGIKLSNNGEVITLKNGETEVDRLDVSGTEQGVSFGRKADGSRAKFCVPTPRKANVDRPPSIEIETQSGRATDYTRVTLNLKVLATEGSLSDATCSWDFKDGTGSDSCNPPSRSWDNIGVFTPEVKVTTACGDTVSKSLEVVVLERHKAKQSLSSTISSASNLSSSISSKSTSKRQISAVYSSHSSSFEQKMYSTKSSHLSSQNAIELLPKRYKNISPANVPDPRNSSSLGVVDDRVLALMEANLTNQDTPSSSSSEGVVWLLLFVQSAVWVVVSGKNLL